MKDTSKTYKTVVTGPDIDAAADAIEAVAARVRSLRAAVEVAKKAHGTDQEFLGLAGIKGATDRLNEIVDGAESNFERVAKSARRMIERENERRAMDTRSKEKNRGK